MEAKHTPSPWFVVKQNNAGSEGTQVWARGGDVRVANCDSGAVSLEGRRADARLIAAAPELLEALELAYRHLNGGRDTLTPAEFHRAHTLARDAIAKATGAAS